MKRPFKFASYIGYAGILESFLIPPCARVKFGKKLLNLGGGILVPFMYKKISTLNIKKVYWQILNINVCPTEPHLDPEKRNVLK